MKIILLHGTDGDETNNWIPWMKAQLEKRGHEVFAPSLPDSAYPDGEKWTDYILENVPFEFDEETVVCGHSAGAALIPMLLQKLPEGKRIGKAILVSGFYDDLGWDKLKDLFNVVVDYDRVKQKAGEIVLLHSDNDPYVDLAQAEWLAEKLDGKLELISGQGHFNLEFSSKYKEFPRLLEIILEESVAKRLYLMSSFRGKGVAEMVMGDIEGKLGKEAREMKVLYITTAGNLHPADKRDWINEGRELLQTRGWDVVDYDIAGKTEMEVEAKVQKVDVVFVQGGQCIYMLEQTQKCNFAEIIKRALARGVPYMGESTGSIITGRDIFPYTFLQDDKRENPRVLENYKGLGLVNFLVRPHWNCQSKQDKYSRKIIDNFDKFYTISEPIILLNDNQLVYVEGENFQIWEGK